MVVRIERFDATGWASKASDRCSFAKISENNKVWCNGRGKPLALRKANGIVQMQNQKVHTDVSITKSGWDSAENLIDGADEEQSPP